jgi:hypothetical protein
LSLPKAIYPLHGESQQKVIRGNHDRHGYLYSIKVFSIGYRNVRSALQVLYQNRSFATEKGSDLTIKGRDLTAKGSDLITKESGLTTKGSGLFNKFRRA